MVRTQIQLTAEQARALKEIARTRGVSVAEVIRQAVDGVIRQPRAPDREERWRRALAAVGCVAGDGASVAELHDEWLDDAFSGR